MRLGHPSWTSQWVDARSICMYRELTLTQSSNADFGCIGPQSANRQIYPALYYDCIGFRQVMTHQLGPTKL